ncbi:MAG TPA: non-homologous end-joining DNA ligase, partial [Verrucomicrobiae bacterium]|nr:non-homologous end-joining DNA ligase [Verrucomicrobiae bacterium]
VTAGNEPWESLAGYAVGLHTQRRAVQVATIIPKKARTYKTPEQLESYSAKRSFGQTPEPRPAPLSSAGSAFVVHRHHASRLHYDLRLEHEGVLRSWAVPKGLPPRPGIMRLAVQVEDHPIEYVGFEGTIPKGEYGGGQMWKFAQGRHEITKQKKNGFYFRLEAPELTGEYRIHNTREKQWLLERVDTPQLDWVRAPVQPMLACPSDAPRDSKHWLYEVKWDGIRALISLDEGEIRIRGRNGIDLTRQFPELLSADSAFRATSALFDGEIVCLDSAGKPVFSDVISRMQQRSAGAVDRLRARHPAVCYLFDCLYLDGRAIVNEPLSRRREWLADTLKEASAYRLSDTFEDGVSLLEAVRQHGLEGVMAKRKDSSYLPGKRRDSWLKIKPRRTTECLIVGYTAGQGDRAGSFGALHLAQPEDGELRYVGKVGSGFDEGSLEAVFAILKDLTTSISSVKHRPTAPGSVWVEPKLVCEVAFASFTGSGILREPVFVRLRPDLSY